MKIELYEQVSLRHDLPEYGLKQGDVATLVEYVPHPHDGEEGCILEVFNAVGESISVVVVPVSTIEPLRADEILSVRSFASRVQTLNADC
ncbi:MAG: DUF4926 domain-containing protein [Anaerolineae bacterium]